VGNFFKNRSDFSTNGFIFFVLASVFGKIFSHPVSFCLFLPFLPLYAIFCQNLLANDTVRVQKNACFSLTFNISRPVGKSPQKNKKRAS
jgi:hypothetical protein